MGTKRSTSTSYATRADSVTQGTGRYVFCPGSGIAHDQVFLEIMQGPKVRFVRCPLLACGVKAFLRGARWLEPKVGLTRAEARDANPNATIF